MAPKVNLTTPKFWKLAPPQEKFQPATTALTARYKLPFIVINHHTLFRYGVQGKVINWFLSYVIERKQFSKINGVRSKPLGVTCGIPKGSCLGPLLFIVYLNDFEECLPFSPASMYADDTHTTIASDDINELAQMMQEELQNISEWMRVNKITVNPNKTEFMFIGHLCRINKIETLAPLKLNDTEIKRVGKTKSLGVVVDENLSWKEQFKSLKGKVTSGLSALKKLKNILPQSKLCEVYHVWRNFWYLFVVYQSSQRPKKTRVVNL